MLTLALCLRNLNRCPLSSCVDTRTWRRYVRPALWALQTHLSRIAGARCGVSWCLRLPTAPTETGASGLTCSRCGNGRVTAPSSRLRMWCLDAAPSSLCAKPRPQSRYRCAGLSLYRTYLPRGTDLSMDIWRWVLVCRAAPSSLCAKLRPRSRYRCAGLSLFRAYLYPDVLIYLWIYGAGFWFAEPLLRHCVPSFALEADTGARVHLYIEHIYTQMH